jgi:hypothetical protein
MSRRSKVPVLLRAAPALFMEMSGNAANEF